MLRDGGTYVEMGQFTDAGSIETNWHRICVKDIKLIGSWGITANDLPAGIDMLDRARDRYPWRRMQTEFPFTEAGGSGGCAKCLRDALRQSHHPAKCSYQLIPKIGR